MCRIRTGAKIRNMEDVRSVITAMILRQQSRYSKKDIFECVKYFMEDAPEIVNDRALDDMIDLCLDVFSRCGEVRCKTGYYYPSDLMD